MEIIHLFILKCSGMDRDYTRTLESFGDLVNVYNYIGNVNDINEIEKQSDWYFLIYDNEFISESLKESLPVFVEQSYLKGLVCYKKISETSYMTTPRMFRKEVKLKKDSLLPENFTLSRDGHILNGFIYGIEV